MTTTAPVLDDTTAAAIHAAVEAARAGRLGDACRIGERALQDGGDEAALNAMLGMFRTQSGELDRAIAHLEMAHRARPADIRIAHNLASALAQQGRYEQALDVLTDELARSDASLQLLKLRGFLAQTLEQFPTAIAAYERVVAANADDWESWNNLGNARRGAEDFDGSVAALRNAADLRPDSAPVQLNLANALAWAGEFEAAERQFRAMAERFPEDPKPLRGLHGLLKQQARDEEALEAIEAAVARDPEDIELWLGLASHRLAMLKHAAAEEAYREVLKRDPANDLGNLGLGVVFELTNRTDELSKLAGEAEARGAGPDALNFIRALDHRRARRFSEGLEALAKVPAELESARRAHLLGQLEEGAGNYDAAFASFERMNEIQRDDLSQPEERAAAYRTNIRRQMELLTPEWASAWSDAQSDDRRSPAFLVGFPRSGTTLLDTFLMGHSDTQVFEEEPMLRHAQQQLGAFETFPDASDERIRAARDAYFETAANLAPLRPGALLVDKNPLVMNGLPLIHRLFPDAKIILALRHPCDVVLSCFITNFKPNDGMASFMRLETAAELYDLSFSYFEKAKEILGIPVHTVVYEKVVADRESELRPLFNFLGLDWHERALDHQATARGRAHIKTASYAQVVEPIYSRSAGRWVNYRKHLEPVLPVLRPWIEKFGYEA
ncbi:MAG: tetratricopeptide repeat-containing sulfotransferase family protein [Sphingomicrobium sp.]